MFSVDRFVCFACGNVFRHHVCVLCLLRSSAEPQLVQIGIGGRCCLASNQGHHDYHDHRRHHDHGHHRHDNHDHHHHHYKRALWSNIHQKSSSLLNMSSRLSLRIMIIMIVLAIMMTMMMLIIIIIITIMMMMMVGRVATIAGLSYHASLHPLCLPHLQHQQPVLPSISWSWS